TSTPAPLRHPHDFVTVSDTRTWPVRPCRRAGKRPTPGENSAAVRPVSDTGTWPGETVGGYAAGSAAGGSAACAADAGVSPVAAVAAEVTAAWPSAGFL